MDEKIRMASPIQGMKQSTKEKGDEQQNDLDIVQNRLVTRPPSPILQEKKADTIEENLIDSVLAQIPQEKAHKH